MAAAPFRAVSNRCWPLHAPCLESRKCCCLTEPLEGLAPVICDMLMDVLERITKSGSQTLVLVEQHTGLAVDFADRVVILDGGEIVHAGASQALLENPGVLERHMGIGLMEAD